MTDDLIGRAEAQTAIQFAARRYMVAHEAHGEGQVVWSDNLINVTDAMNVLRDLPPVQPERKIGRWIPTYEDCCADVWVKWKCSECGYVRKKGWKQTYDGAKPDALFCEMCNADMRGEG